MEEEICAMVNRFGIREKVLILFSRNDIPDLLNAMDVFVFPSLYEGLGITLIEAQFASLRCVTSDCVPNDVYITSNVSTLNLNDDISVWLNAVFGNVNNTKKFAEESDYDINLEIKKLEWLCFHDV